MRWNQHYVRRELHKALANSVAFDSAEGASGENLVGKVLELLRDKIGPEDLRKVIAALQGEQYEPIAAADDEPDDELGIPNPDGVRAGQIGGALQAGSRWNGKKAGQALDADYRARFPHGDRVIADSWGVPVRGKPYRPMTATERKEYDIRFPNADRIK